MDHQQQQRQRLLEIARRVQTYTEAGNFNAAKNSDALKPWFHVKILFLRILRLHGTTFEMK